MYSNLVVAHVPIIPLSVCNFHKKHELKKEIFKKQYAVDVYFLNFSKSGDFFR